MKILLIHQNFPGQYLRLAPELARRGHEVLGMGDSVNIRRTRPTPGVRRISYPPPKKTPSKTDKPTVHPYLHNFEGQVRRGQQVARMLLKLRQQGYRPDLIHLHPGWGEGLYLKDVYPKVPVIGLFEYFYHGRGQDTGFDPEFPADLDAMAKMRTWNANHLLALDAADVGVCPTGFQKSVHPPEFHNRLNVIHDGIDVHVACPDPNASVSLNKGDVQIELNKSDQVVTFVNRNLEPYRGYHTFVRSLPALLEANKQAKVVIVGGTGKGYGQQPKEGTWKRIYFDQIKSKVDTSRVFFFDRIPYPKLIELFQVSTAHVYLTYPFVLSWSLLDAMSCGCAIVGSRTEPVEEVVTHERNGLLTDFFDPQALAEAVSRLLADPQLRTNLGAAARETAVSNYSLEVCMPRQIELIEKTYAS